MHMFEVIMLLLLAAGMALAGWFTVAPPAQNATPVATTAPVAATVTPAAASSPTAPAIDGRYTGQLAIANITLDIVVTLTADGDDFTGAIDIPQQGATGIPLHDIVVTAPTVSFAMLEGAQQAIFEGQVADDGSISGVMRQGGFEGEFSLTPEAPAADASDPAAAPLPAGTQALYESADRQYTVPIPNNWQVEGGAGAFQP